MYKRQEFAPPPPELKGSKHLPKGKGGAVRNRNGKAIPTKTRLEVPEEGASERMAVGEGGRVKAEHEDVGQDLKGRWRACLAESGKVGPSVRVCRRAVVVRDGV